MFFFLIVKDVSRDPLRQEKKLSRGRSLTPDHFQPPRTKYVTICLISSLVIQPFLLHCMRTFSSREISHYLRIMLCPKTPTSLAWSIYFICYAIFLFHLYKSLTPFQRRCVDYKFRSRSGTNDMPTPALINSMNFTEVSETQNGSLVILKPSPRSIGFNIFNLSVKHIFVVIFIECRNYS